MMQPDVGEGTTRKPHSVEGRTLCHIAKKRLQSISGIIDLSSQSPRGSRGNELLNWIIRKIQAHRVMLMNPRASFLKNGSAQLSELMMPNRIKGGYPPTACTNLLETFMQLCTNRCRGTQQQPTNHIFPSINSAVHQRQNVAFVLRTQGQGPRLNPHIADPGPRSFQKSLTGRPEPSKPKVDRKNSAYLHTLYNVLRRNISPTLNCDRIG